MARKVTTLYRLDPLVRGPLGPRTGGYNLYKTRKAKWLYLDNILNHTRTFLSTVTSSYMIVVVKGWLYCLEGFYKESTTIIRTQAAKAQPLL